MLELDAMHGEELNRVRDKKVRTMTTLRLKSRPMQTRQLDYASCEDCMLRRLQLPFPDCNAQSPVLVHNRCVCQDSLPVLHESAAC